MSEQLGVYAADDLELLRKSLGNTERVVAGVRRDQFGLSTPCPDWTVRTLLNHMVAGNIYFAHRARDEQTDMSTWTSEHIGSRDPVEVYAASAREALDAWASPGATERRATLPSGGEGPRIFA